MLEASFWVPCSISFTAILGTTLPDLAITSGPRDSSGGDPPHLHPRTAFIFRHAHPFLTFKLEVI